MGRKSHKRMPWMCGQCKTGFDSEAAVRQHIASAHPRIHRCGIYKRASEMDGPDYHDEPSFADRTIAAQTAVDAGEHTDDLWLLGR